MVVIWHFDKHKQLIAPIKNVVEIIHQEGDYKATAQIRARSKPANGDFFGFECVDGRFRLFLIVMTECKDADGTCTLTGTDAALAELDGRIVERVALKQVTLESAVNDSIAGTEWQLGSVTADMSAEIIAQDAYYVSRWMALKTAAENAKARVVPYYVIDNDRIAGRRIDIITKTPEFKGVVLTRKRGAQNIVITEDGAPKGRVFGIGKVIADGVPPEQLTFASAVWSVEKGDPVDKPEGQTWVALPGAETEDEYVFEAKYEEDPQKLLQKAYEDLVSTQKPKASGTASITDVEYLPGYEHRAVRMWDRVVVRTASGYTVESTVLNISRYYVQKQYTKITIGDERENSLDAQIAKLTQETKSAGRGAGGASAAAGVAMNIVIEAQESVRVLSKAIELKADVALVEQLEESTLVHLQTVQVLLDSVNTRIDLTAQKVDVDNLANVVNEVSAQLTVQAGQISSRVSKNGVISAINHTAETITINANRINLEGYVTASQLQAEVARIDKFFSGVSQVRQLDANILTCQSAQITNLSLINYDVEWKDGDYVTDVTFPTYYETTIYFVDWDGEKVYQRVLLPTKRSAGNVSKDTNHKYLGRKIDN